MSSITIRRLPEPTKEKLRLRAAHSGLSLEAYLRQVLQNVAKSDTIPSPNLADLAEDCFGPGNGIDLELPPRGKNRQPISFD